MQWPHSQQSTWQQTTFYYKCKMRNSIQLGLSLLAHSYCCLSVWLSVCVAVTMGDIQYPWQIGKPTQNPMDLFRRSLINYVFYCACTFKRIKKAPLCGSVSRNQQILEASSLFIGNLFQKPTQQFISENETSLGETIQSTNDLQQSNKTKSKVFFHLDSKENAEVYLKCEITPVHTKMLCNPSFDKNERVIWKANVDEQKCLSSQAHATCDTAR